MTSAFVNSRLASSVALALIGINSPALLAQEDDRSVERVVVYGQKIDRTLQETPASVAVITGDMIEKENLNDFYDVLTRTPNVAGVESSGFSIRGIDAFNVTGGGSGGLASVYIDGAPVPYRMMQQEGFSTWDISQVEVLRGPQSTLQGRNALAGAVVMKTKDAEHEYTFKGRVGLGEYGYREGAIALGGSVIEDELAFRFSGEKRDFDGYNTNVGTGDTSDYNNTEFYRAKLRYTPSALPEFEAQLSFMHSETDKGIPWVATESKDVNFPINDIYDDRYVYLDSPTYEDTDVDLYVLNIDYDFSDKWSFASVSTYSDATYGYEWDGDASIGPVQSTLVDERTDETLSQELRLTYEGDKLSGLIGFYYSDLDVLDVSSGERGMTFEELGFNSLLVAPPEAGGLGLPPEFAAQVLQLYAAANPAFISQASTYIQKVKTAALFADFTYTLNDHWDIFAGIRYDREKQENGTLSDIGISTQTQQALPNPEDYAANPMLAQLIAGINQQLYAMAADASGDEPVVDDSFSAWLPKLGTTYRFNDDVSTSFSIQKGYRSGGVGTNVAQATTYTFDPEYTWNYEWALRSVLLDDKLVLNANLFYIDWTDQQVSVLLSGNRYDTETRNVGESHVQGFETEFDYQFNSQLSVYGGLGYSKTEFDTFVQTYNGEATDFSGRSFSGAPQWTGLVGMDYEHSSGIQVNMNANYRGTAQTLTIPTATGLDPKNDAAWVLNARAGYQWDNFGVYAQLENILDEQFLVQADTGTGSQTLSKPRTFSVRFEAEF